MKKIILLSFLFLFVSEGIYAAIGKKNKKKVTNPIEVKKDSVNADYKKVTKDAVIKQGLFTTFLSKKKIICILRFQIQLFRILIY